MGGGEGGGEYDGVGGECGECGGVGGGDGGDECVDGGGVGNKPDFNSRKSDALFLRNFFMVYTGKIKK